MKRLPTLDQQIADVRRTVQQRRRLRSRIDAARYPVAAEAAERRLRLAEAVLATLEGARIRIDPAAPAAGARYAIEHGPAGRADPIPPRE